MAQSGNGRIRLFNDFFGVGSMVASTADPAAVFAYPLGDFYGGGEGIEDNDAGFIPSTVAPLSGVVTLTSGNANAQTAFIGTQIGFDVGLMGAITMETRIQIPDFDTQEIFFGLTSILTTDEQLEEAASNIPEIYSQPKDSDHPGNSRFDKGTYVGQTVHEVFVDRGDMAIKFFKFVSKSPVYKDTVYAKAVVLYCKLRGVDLTE